MYFVLVDWEDKEQLENKKLEVICLEIAWGLIVDRKMKEVQFSKHLDLVECDFFFLENM
jgi:hypothetical protein